MATATIQTRKNGSLRVEGEVRLIDHEGNEYKVQTPFSLCRCGQSNNKPFCDSTHRTCGFTADQTAE
jgi:CDGSH-type Zn-finger protein